MPLELADKCIKAGCPQGGIVLDPFGGAGTTAIVALQNLCHYFLIELNPSYVYLAQERIKQQKLEGVQLSLFKAGA
jgi:DNA modification methylase